MIAPGRADRTPSEQIRGVRELRTAPEVGAASTEPMMRWAAQALLSSYPHRRGRAWANGGAVAVFAPSLNRHDRLVFTGEPDAATDLLERVLPLTPSPKLRPLATAGLAEAVCARSRRWEIRGTFGWMDLAGDVVPRAVGGVDWLPASADAEIDELLGLANPSAYVRPGDPGAARWAGVRDGSGVLVSVAAQAWSMPRCGSGPGLGFLAGVATRPGYRGQGLSGAVCGFVTAALRAEFGAVALMVDSDNPAAIAIYDRLGFRYRSVSGMGPASP